ncbi:MAG: helix-turn-helix transcriptional regulator [Phycisphaerae bacterium]|jgi:DNA-binding Xre family transcriptional regulator|nr:helix-turn-helix transcriptional regulator [Phycisphaerae bacterium]HOO17931.1 helix-turn-helix transcriptional regulator [Phycisphaerae bacterium]HPC23840.1 helix-turn-helix transcriptional regulator [Phycisphaerae bacterium]HRS26870.1 helix-turn-helix transcriptional regulator [Phycisphaerae bacterium]HRT41998.1 helix-turn-helix transcriptional regulator [Phycisphaerae bacterium]
MIVVKLREAMEAYRRRTGRRITYEELAQRTGVAHSTLRSIGSRLGYTPTFANLEKLCRALQVPLHDMLEMIDDPPKMKRAARQKSAGPPRSARAPARRNPEHYGDRHAGPFAAAYR